MKYGTDHPATRHNVPRGDTNFTAWFTRLVRSKSRQGEVMVSSRSGQGQVRVSSRSDHGQLAIRSRSDHGHIAGRSYEQKAVSRKQTRSLQSLGTAYIAEGYHCAGLRMIRVCYNCVITSLFRMLSTVSWQSYLISSASTLYVHKINLIQSSGWWQHICWNTTSVFHTLFTRLKRDGLRDTKRTKQPGTVLTVCCRPMVRCSADHVLIFTNTTTYPSQNSYHGEVRHHVQSITILTLNLLAPTTVGARINP